MERITKLLIKLADFEEYKYITSNITELTQLEPYVREAQEFDLRPVLDCSDEEFLKDIVDNPGGYGTLISYIKPVLIYYTYARFLSGHGVFVTPSGIVEKNNEFSQPVSDARLSRLITQAESAALEYQKRLTDYLQDNLDTYTLWKCGSGSGRHKSGARIKAIGGTSSQTGGGECNESWEQFSLGEL